MKTAPKQNLIKQFLLNQKSRHTNMWRQNESSSMMSKNLVMKLNLTMYQKDTNQRTKHNSYEEWKVQKNTKKIACKIWL